MKRLNKVEQKLLYENADANIGKKLGIHFLGMIMQEK